ncbi:5426_t:CDS:1, partial [Acaulospora morrowiae]
MTTQQQEYLTILSQDLAKLLDIDCCSNNDDVFNSNSITTSSNRSMTNKINKRQSFVLPRNNDSDSNLIHRHSTSIKQSLSNPNFSNSSASFKTTLRTYRRSKSCDDYNVIIKVGQETDNRIFYAHSLILKVRSEYFNAAFGNRWVKTEENGMMIFEKPNIEPIIFE